MPKAIHFRILGYTITLVMHICNIIYMASFLKGDVMQDKRILKFSGFQRRYLTVWTFFLQIVHAFTGLICDLLTLMNSNKKNYQLPKYLRGFRDTLFAGIVWPATFVVFTIFWSLTLYDRDLVLPEFIDKVLTRTSNHIIHTAIVPIVLWEVVFQPRRIPTSHKHNINHMVVYFLLYLVAICYTYASTGVWLYPFVAMAWGTIYFPVLILVMVVLSLTFYYLQWIPTYLIWGSVEKKRTVEKNNKRKVR